MTTVIMILVQLDVRNIYVDVKTIVKERVDRETGRLGDERTGRWGDGEERYWILDARFLLPVT